MRGLKIYYRLYHTYHFIENDDVAPDDVSLGDTSSHNMSLDDMSPYGPYDIRLWALHFEWAKRLKTRCPLVDLVYKDLIF